MNIIGIIGGVGPFAGVDLTSKIFTQTMARCDQDHLPVALLSFPEKIPDRTDYLLGRVAVNPARPVSHLILQLENLGASVVGIPCNTMHAPGIFDVIQSHLKQKGSRIELLHMVGEVVGFIKAVFPDMQQVGVLSTTGTWKTGVYRHALQRAGFQPMVPERDLQDLVHQAIYNKSYGIKAMSNPIHPKAQQQLIKAARVLKKEGAEGLILGCTEISYAFNQQSLEGLPLFDPTWILARRLIEATYPERLKPLEDFYHYSW